MSIIKGFCVLIPFTTRKDITKVPKDQIVASLKKKKKLTKMPRYNQKGR